MINFTDQNFESELQRAEKPVLVDFFTDWCHPCAILGPVLEKVAEEFKEDIIFSKVNLDQIPLTAQKFGVDRIPTVVLFREGKPSSGFMGVQPESAIRDWLAKSLKKEDGKQ